MQLRLPLAHKTLAVSARPQRAPRNRSVLQCNTLWQLQPGEAAP